MTSARRLDALIPERGFAWVHVDLAEAEGGRFAGGFRPRPLALAALTAGETRPRCTVHGEMVLLNLRGVNLNPGAEPVVARLNGRLDDLEEALGAAVDGDLRHEVADVRRVSSVLRRFIFPQRDAPSALEIEELGRQSARDRPRPREAAERVTRLAEDLDAIHDRAQVVRDQVVDIRAEAVNRQMPVISVVAAICLPLGLLSGLLGINVGGIPGTDVPWAVWVVCGLLVLVCLFQIRIFGKLKLLGRGEPRVRASRAAVRGPRAPARITAGSRGVRAQTARTRGRKPR